VVNKITRLSPLLWSGLIFAVSQVLTLFVAFQEKSFLEQRQITPPEISLGLPLVYFFGSVIVLSLILFLVPPSKLTIVLKIMFVFLYSWGVFIVLGFFLPIPIAVPISVAGGLLWLFRPRIWFHDLLLLVTLVGMGSVFGVLFSPWTAISFMLIISAYDILAVRFGYMMWMARRLLESDTLPAFIIPKGIPGWNTDLRKAKLVEDKSTEREFSVLGGGDIGLPLMLIVSVFFNYGLGSSLIIAAFSLLGLISACSIQVLFLKGKPMPALPPISFLSLIGLLTVYFS